VDVGTIVPVLKLHILLGRDDNQVEEWSHMTTESAAQLLISEHDTAASHWGKQLKHPEWPCIAVPGGVRGTSKASRKNQRRGTSGWRLGEQHTDFLPVEQLKIRIRTADPSFINL
jgi:hypothetical protein